MNNHCTNLHAFLADSLPATEAEAFRQHFPDCTACQREMPTMLQLDALVRGITHADKERIRETLRPLLRSVYRKARNPPSGYPDDYSRERAVNDVLCGVDGEPIVVALANVQGRLDRLTALSQVIAKERGDAFGEVINVTEERDLERGARVAAVDNAVQEAITRLQAEHEAERTRLVAKHAEEVRRLAATIASQGETIKMLSPPATRGQS